MKISEILKTSKKAFPSIEIVPPLKGLSRDELLSSIRPFMDYAPRYVNVTCHRDEYEFVPNTDGTFSRRIVRNRVSEVAVSAAIMEAFKVEVVPHIICAGASREHIFEELESLYFMGIENIVALRGDCLAGEKRFTPEPDGYAYASELVDGIRKHRPDLDKVFCVGVGAYPEKHFEAPNIETDIINLKKKVDAGADYIITQMFFDNRVYYDFVDKCRAAGIFVPIIPGLKPLSTEKQLTALPEAFSLNIPLELSSEISGAFKVLPIDKAREAAYAIGTEWCARQCADLIAHGVPAVHFYTMGKSKNICEILKKCF